MSENSKSFRQFLTSKTGQISLILVLYVVILLLLVGVIQLFNGSDMVYVPMIFALVLAVFGWKALNRITPDIFLIMPIGRWFTYFFIKGCLSLLIGCFVAPFVIAKFISKKIAEQI